MVLEDMLSIVLPNCPSTVLAQNELWMVDLGFLLFCTFLISFSFRSFLFKNLQDWTLNGKIVDFSFLKPFSFCGFFFQKPAISTLEGKILDSYFLMPFSF